jgi:hypothetical protein
MPRPRTTRSEDTKKKTTTRKKKTTRVSKPKKNPNKKDVEIINTQVTDRNAAKDIFSTIQDQRWVLDGRFLIIKVGTPESPASQEMIDGIQNELSELMEDNEVNCLIWVTHHAVEVQII